MSLFCTYDWWSVQCAGKLEDKTNQIEEIDFHTESLYVADLMKGKPQIIFVGNHSGTLWAFKPTSTKSPQDLLFEYNFGKPIIALGSGRLLLGSQENHLAVLHPTKMNIYSFHQSYGNTVHGQQYHLEPIYTISFQFLAYNIVIGPFGSGVSKSAEKDKNVRSKSAQDSVCVQAMDGSLHFYETDLNFLYIPPKSIQKGSLPFKREKLPKDLKSSTRRKSRNSSFYDQDKTEDAVDVTRAEVHNFPSDDILPEAQSIKTGTLEDEGTASMNLSRGVLKEVPEEGERDIQQLDSEARIGDNYESTIQISKPKFILAPFEDTVLPTLLCYMPPEDCFVIFSGSWTIDCYRYTTLELQQIGTRKKKSILPEWTYVLGEPIFSLSYLEGCVFALGTRGTFVCLNQYGVVRFCKKLCYCPSATCTYATDGKLMLLVVSEEGTLMVYDAGPALTNPYDSQLYPLPTKTSSYIGRLVWSAKLPFTPIAIARGSFEELSGLVIILSDQGYLQCCHLGTTPINFMEMPRERIELNEELEEVEEKLGEQTIGEDELNPLALSKEGMELSLELVLNSAKLLPFNEYTSRKIQGEENDDGERTSSYFSSAEVDISLILVPLIPINNVCLSATVEKPLVASFEKSFIERLYEEVKIPLHVSAHYVESFHQDAIPNLRVEVVVSGFGGFTGTAERLSLSAFHASIVLPLSTVFSVNHFLDTEQTEEFHFPSTNDKSSRLDLFLYGNRLKRILVTRECKEETSEAGPLDCIYSISSSCILPLYSLTNMLSERIKKYTSTLGRQIAGSGGRQKAKLFQLTLRTPLPVKELLEAVDDHFSARQKVVQLKHDLSIYTKQLHMAECSVLSKVRDVTPKPAMFTEVLLEQFFEKVFNGIEALEGAQKELVSKTEKLRTLIDLVVHLQPEISGNPKFKNFEMAISVEMQDYLQQGWEERTEAGLAYLLKRPGKSIPQQFNVNALISMDQNPLCTHSLKNEIADLLEKFINIGKSEDTVQPL